MATTKVINDLIDLNQTGNTTALKGCVGTTAKQPGKTGEPAAVEGMLRANTDLTSGKSTSAMQFYKASSPSGWVTLTNTANTTLGDLDVPPGKTAMAVYSLQTNTSDSSGNYDATNYNVTFSSDGFRTGTGSGIFNGTSSVGLMQNSATAFNIQEWTYSCWVKPDVLGGCLWGQYNNTHQGRLIYITAAGKIESYWIYVGNAGNQPTQDIYSTGTISTGVWSHVCVTFSSTTGVHTIYINGPSGNVTTTNLGAGYTMQYTAQNPGTSFGQLRSHDTSSGYYDGLIQEIRLYNSALSSTDVGLLYTQQ